MTAASLSRLFGSTWSVALAAFVAGGIGVGVRLLLRPLTVNALALPFVVALVSGIVAVGLIRLFPNQSPVLCLTAAGMVLVPGPALLNGVRDLVGGHAGIAVGRLTMGAVTILAIGFALFLAAAIAGDTLPVAQGAGRLPVWEDALFSMAAVFGYAMLHDVPPKVIPVAMLCALVSHPLRTALGGYGVDPSVGSLIGAFVAGVVALVAVRRVRLPAVAFAFPGVVAMIPGSYGFRAGVGGLELMARGASSPAALVTETVSLVVATCVMTGAIAVGLSMAFSLPFSAVADGRTRPQRGS